MVNPKRFYTYAYLREDKTPYYIGKGQRKRIYQQHGKPCVVPKDKSRIIFLKQNLTEEEAFKHEIYMIAVLGRIDLGTGILHNKSIGGGGCSGYIHTKEAKEKISKIHKGKKLSDNLKNKISIATKGRKHSEEHKKLISQAITGIIRSKETREKMSKSKIGKNNPVSNLWKLTFLNGTEIILCGLTNWAKENNYNDANIHHVYTKKLKKYKDIISVEKLSDNNPNEK